MIPPSGQATPTRCDGGAHSRARVRAKGAVILDFIEIGPGAPVGKLFQTLRQKPEWIVLVVALQHRAVLWWRMQPALLALVAQAPCFQVMQLLPVEIYRRRFWTGLWLLQQTPPVPHLVFRLALGACG